MSQRQSDIDAVRSAKSGVVVNAVIDLIWCVLGVVPMMFCGAGLCLMVGGVFSLLHLYLGMVLFRTEDEKLGESSVFLFSPLFSLLCLNPVTAVLGFVRWSRIEEALERLAPPADDPSDAPDTHQKKAKKKLGKKRIKALPRDVRSVFKDRDEDWLHIDEDADLVIAALEDSTAPDHLKRIRLPLLEAALAERFAAIDFPRLRDLELDSPDETTLRILAEAMWLPALTQFEIRGESTDVGDAAQVLAENATGVRDLVLGGVWFEHLRWPRPLKFLQISDATPDALPLLPPVERLRLFGDLEHAEWPRLQGVKELTAYCEVNASLAQRLRDLPSLVELDTFLGPELVGALAEMPWLEHLKLHNHTAFEGIEACLIRLAQIPLPALQAIDLGRLSLDRWPAELLDALAARPKLVDVCLKNTVIELGDLERWANRDVLLDVTLKRRYALEVAALRLHHPRWSIGVENDGRYEGEIPTETISFEAPSFQFSTTTGFPVWMDDARGGGVVSQTQDGFMLRHGGSTSSSRVHGLVSDLAAVSSSQVALRTTDGAVVLVGFSKEDNAQTIEVEAGRFFGDPERGRVLVDTGAGVIQFNRHGVTDFPTAIDLSGLSALAPITEAALWVQRASGELVLVDGDRMEPHGTGPLCQHLVPSPDGSQVLGYGFSGLVLWGNNSVHHVIEEPVLHASWQKRSDGFVVVFEHRIEARLRTGELHASRSVKHESITCAVRCDDSVVWVYTEDSYARVILHEVLR